MRESRQQIVSARRAERSGHLKEAIRLYENALRGREGSGEGADLALFNHLGDLYLRVGDREAAVEWFEAAADRYEEQQLYSNAIALCKKILRNAPARLEVHRRAGRLLTLAGLGAEARSHYTEYATLREQEGSPDAALEALHEFAELSGDEQVRLALADRYLEAGDTDGAVKQLRSVWTRQRDRGEEAAAIRERIVEVDPGADPLAREIPPAGAPARGGADGAATEKPASDGGDAGSPGGSEDVPAEAGLLAAKLEEVLGRLEGEERMRHALPIIDGLLRQEPGSARLLLRKLGYALGLADGERAVDAYLGLGALLEDRVPGFSLRLVSSSSDSGAVTVAVDPGSRPAVGSRE